MFDLATLPQPNRTDAAVLVGVPFDWRLTKPAAPSDYRFTDYSNHYEPAASYTEALATYALALENTLNTAVILSLFTDRRAGRDDRLPFNATDRRGWLGEEFVGGDTGDDPWGSSLWLLPGKATDDVLEHARFAAREALAWLLRDGIVSRIEVEAQWVGERADRLAVRPTLYKPGQLQPVYDVLWGTSVRRWSA